MSATPNNWGTGKMIAVWALGAACFFIILQCSYQSRTSTIPDELPLVELGDINDFIGESVMIRARITEVRRWRDYVFINFGGRYPNHTFTLVVPPLYPYEIGYTGGELIEIGGLVEMYKGKPQIVADGENTFFPNWHHRYKGLETTPGLRGPEPLDF